MATVLALGILASSKRADDSLGGQRLRHLRQVFAHRLLFSTGLAAAPSRDASSASTCCAIFA